jgi:hypothetical protein
VGTEQGCTAQNIGAVVLGEARNLNLKIFSHLISGSLKSRPMKKPFALLLICLFSVALTKSDEDVYNPLGVGMRWEASLDITAPDGRVLHGTAIHEITGTKVISGKTYFVSMMKVEGIPGPPEMTAYRRKTASGVFMIEGKAIGKGEQLETALPLTVGKTWTRTTSEDEKIVYTVEKKGTISVDDQRYENSVKVAYTVEGKTRSGYFWLAPNIGNVEEQFQIGGVTFHFKTKSFKAGK